MFEAHDIDGYPEIAYFLTMRSSLVPKQIDHAVSHDQVDSPMEPPHEPIKILPGLRGDLLDLWKRAEQTFLDQIVVIGCPRWPGHGSMQGLPNERGQHSNSGVCACADTMERKLFCCQGSPL